MTTTTEPPALQVIDPAETAAGLAKPKHGRDILTSGQIAKVCGVAPRTVTKWIDAGRVRGHRLPGSGDRRVYAADLLAFLREAGMRVPPWLEQPLRVAAGVSLADLAGLGDGWRLADQVGVGEMLSQPITHAVVGDEWGVNVSLSIARRLLARHPHARVAVVVSEDAPKVLPDTPCQVYRRPLAWSQLSAELAAG
ncbi:MAG: hypothetical protein K2P78_14535 [Gemmataceae bacterium]|nr:hypothetical protein [Gemmataceae bacterium]